MNSKTILLIEDNPDDRTRGLPVIVLTVSGKEQDLLDSQGLGADGYIRKPLKLSLFVGAVPQRDTLRCSKGRILLPGHSVTLCELTAA